MAFTISATYWFLPFAMKTDVRPDSAHMKEISPSSLPTRRACCLLESYPCLNSEVAAVTIWTISVGTLTSATVAGHQFWGRCRPLA